MDGDKRPKEKGPDVKGEREIDDPCGLFSFVRL